MGRPLVPRLAPWATFCRPSGATQDRRLHAVPILGYFISPCRDWCALSSIVHRPSSANIKDLAVRDERQMAAFGQQKGVLTVDAHPVFAPPIGDDQQRAGAGKVSGGFQQIDARLQDGTAAAFDL